jgi:hypothetical protein
MPDLREDFHATADSIRRDAERVKILEEQKRALDPTDPRVLLLSEQVEQLAARLQDKTAAEQDLAEEIQAEG